MQMLIYDSLSEFLCLTGWIVGGFVECVSILLQTDNINVNALDNDGTSVLQAAVISGKSVKVCEMLLEAGADPDSKDVDGDTPREAASEDPEMRTLFVKF